MGSVSMKNINYWVVSGLIFSAALFTSSCSTEMQSKNLDDKDSTSAIPVEVAYAGNGEISAYYSSTATLEADEEAKVVAKVRGVVKELLVEEGDFVSAGDVLASLEDEQLEIEASRAKATMDRLNNEFSRKRELFEKNHISAEEFENAKFEFEAQKSAYELADLKIKYSKIRAPISGVVSDRLIKAGNMVNTDQEVFKITDFDPLLAVLHIPEHEMNKLNKGQAALMHFDALPGESFIGQVLRVSPTVNPETGTFKVTISISDESRQLKPGMFGRVRIVYDTHPNALLIPKNAVITEDGLSSVFVINNKMAYRKTVSTGYTNGNNIEILNGINPADTVVTIGQSSLQDSSLVEVVSY